MHSLPGSCLAWGDQALGSTGSMVGLMATSKRTYGKGDLPGLQLSVPLSLGEPWPTQTSSGDPPTLKGSFGSVSCGVTAPFLEVLVCARSCLRPPTLESLPPPPFLYKSYKQMRRAFKVRFPGDSQAVCWFPRLRSMTCGWEPSQKWKGFFGITVPQFVENIPHGNGISFYCDCAHPTSSIYNIGQVVVAKTIFKKKRCNTENGSLRRSYK